MTAPRVAVIGAGFGALALVRALAAADMDVTVFEADPATCERVQSMLSRLLPDAVCRFAVWAGEVGDTDVVILSPDIGPASVDVSLVLVLGDPSRLAGADLDRMVAVDISGFPLVELCAGSADAGRRATDFLISLDAVIVRCATRGAFPGIILQDTLYAMADRLLLHGTTPWEFDEALCAAGWVAGPLQAQDAIGLDVAFARRRRGGAAPFLVADRMVREGRLGRACGVGWYRYPGGGGAVIDPLMEDMIVEEAWFAGIERREIAPHDLVEAVEIGLITAGLLLKRVDPANFDALLLHKIGYGVPGLMARAEELRAGDLVQRLERLEARFGAPWHVPEALRARAARNRSFPVG